MEKLKVAIAGAAGYTGGELIRLLLNHPRVHLQEIVSSSNAGNPLHAVHQDLVGETELVFSATLNREPDLLFLCFGHGEAKKYLAANPLPAKVKVIDLSNDFRLHENVNFGNRSFVYGLPELNREKIKNSVSIANPGCFASAIILGLLPLAEAGLLSNIYTTGITGSTGAGQSLSPTSHFSWRSNNIQAYKSLSHQHLGEIGQTLGKLQPLPEIDISFVPWRGDFSRGIFISSQLDINLDLEELDALYIDFYKDHPFTHLSHEPIFLKQVTNTNKCLIQLEKLGSKLVIHAILDNLLKGASGQAVQNMNLMAGFEEKEGLKLKASYF